MLSVSLRFSITYNRPTRMTFTPGTKLGTYEIVAPLGAGGMGEVYRARDSKLKREVAIKLLPDAFSRDSGRVARFQREAEVLASLNHPHIGAIYDFSHLGESLFLVLELVEGETLTDRLKIRCAAFRPSPAHRHRDRRCPRPGASSRCGAPGSQAGEHHADEVGSEAPGLWPRQAGRT